GRGDAEMIAFYEALRKRLAGVPGVRAASLSQIPLIGSGTSAATVDLSGGGPVGSRVLDTATGFFETMQIPILLGRAIDERATAGAPLVAVVNQAFARRAFGDRNPLGQRFRMPRICAKCELEIVGVSANTLYGDLKKQAPPIVFLPFTQGVWPLGA